MIEHKDIKTCDIGTAQISDFSRILSDAKSLQCHNCGSTTFRRVVKIKELSIIVSNAMGMPDRLYPIEYFVCDSCDTIHKMFTDDEKFMSFIK